MSYANDHNNPKPPMESRPGGPIDDFHSMTQFIKEAGPFGLKILKFVSARVDKWEAQGGISIEIFGVPVIRIRL